jgi:hypothetical protein
MSIARAVRAMSIEMRTVNSRGPMVGAAGRPPRVIEGSRDGAAGPPGATRDPGRDARVDTLIGDAGG